MNPMLLASGFFVPFFYQSNLPKHSSPVIIGMDTPFFF